MVNQPQMQPAVRPASTGAVVGGRYSFVSQYIYFNLPQHILARLKGKTDFDDLEDTLLYTRLLHEITHFEQNYGTTYGLWKTLSLRSAGEWFRRGIDQLKQLGAPLILPFDRMMIRAQTANTASPISSLASCITMP